MGRLVVLILALWFADDAGAAVEGAFAPLDPEFSYSRLGPVASKIYADDRLGPRFGLGSDFFTFSGGTSATADDPAGRHTNVYSVAPTFGIRVHPRVVFNAQLSFDSGGAESTKTVTLRRGAAIVRFAYLDWLFRENGRAGVRLGHQLIPLGLSNTSADAVTYFGVERPELERTILPGDWHENGALAYHDEGRWVGEVGAFTSLNARGLRGESFLAGGRSQGQAGPSDNVMGVLSLNAREGGWLVGGSFAFGDSAQGNVALPSGSFRLGEMHVRHRAPRFEILGQLAAGRLQDAGVISYLNQTAMGEVAAGGAAHAAFELLGAGEAKLWIYARVTSYNLHAKTPGPFAADPAYHRTSGQIGLHYVPIPSLVFKADVVRRHVAGDVDHNEIWAGAGFIY